MFNRRRLTPARLLALMLWPWLACSGAPAAACSCPPPRSLEAETANADAVFIALVTHLGRGYEAAKRHVTVDVERMWKGEWSGSVQVRTPTHEEACGFRFEPGERYLLFASRRADALEVTRCSLSTPLRDAQALVRQLERR